MPEPLELRLTSAIAALDRDALAACFSPHAGFRALIPPGLRERGDAAGAADLIRSWFADSTDLELIAVQAADFADRKHISWRFRGVENGEHYVVEQHLYCVLDGDRIGSADLICSGFRPADTAV